MSLARRSFPGERTSVSAARSFVAEELGRHRDILGDRVLPEAEATLLTSELVTNAVVHAGTPVEVTCLLTDGLIEIGVEDGHPARQVPEPVLGMPDAPDIDDRVSGRGLVLVAAIADAWGVSYNRTAKRVWFQLGASASHPALPLGPVPADRTGHALLSELLTSDLQEEELLDQTVRMVREIAGGDSACILLATDDPAWLQVGAVTPGLDLPRKVPANGVTDLTVEIIEHPSPGIPIKAGSIVRAPMLAGGEIAGFVLVAAEEPDRFDAEAAERLLKAAGRIAVTLDRVRLADAERARRGWLAFLAEASDLLAGILDENLVAALTAQLVVPRVASWCAVYLDGRLIHAWHADERQNDMIRIMLEEGTRPLEGVVETFPLVLGGERLGSLVLGAHRLTGEVNRLIEDLARRVALALDTARQYRRQALTSAVLQRSLLPRRVPEIPGVASAVVYEPQGDGNVVGGDFYDIFGAGPSRWGFMIGDVCGSGPEAAAVTGFARHAVRLLAQEGHEVPAILERLNRSIADAEAPGRFLSLICGLIAPRGDGGADCVVACAGHPLPLRLRPDGGVSSVATSQLLLGILDEVAYTTDSFTLEPGDALLCVTDGITERRAGPGGRLFDDDDGLAALLSTCAGLNADEIAERIKQAVDAFEPGPPRDDMAMLVLKATT